MGNSKQSVPVIVSRITAMQAGFQKDFTAKQSLTVEGSAMGQPAILGDLAADLALITDVTDARNTLANKSAAKKAGMPGVLKFLSAIEAALKQTFGSGDPRLQDFGIKPPKSRKQLTVEEKALAVASAKGTKAARGILGKNQRGKITTQGTPGLAVVDPQGNVVPGLLNGPTPPGSGKPVDVAPVSAVGGGNAPASGASAPQGASGPGGSTAGAGGNSPPAAGSGK
ncbi:MAG: hypothetical protein ACYDCL_01025 [Myxococcales bacterium]